MHEALNSTAEVCEDSWFALGTVCVLLGQIGGLYLLFAIRLAAL